MKQHIQFLDKDLTGKIVDAMGSDGILPLDGRIGIRRAFVVAHEAIARKSKIKKFVGFEIRRGGIKNFSCVYRDVFA